MRKRNRENRPNRFAAGSKYNTYAKRAETIKRAYAKNPLPYKARRAVRMAIKEGKILRGECQMKNDECSGKIHAHHYLGYEKDNWLKVMWVCNKHHNKIHHEK